jgi:hypothetical protein
MFTQLITIVSRAPRTLLEDSLGVAAIFVILMVGLTLPGL